MSNSKKAGRPRGDPNKTPRTTRVENGTKSGRSPDAGPRADPRPLPAPAAARLRPQEHPNAKSQRLGPTSGCSVRDDSSPAVLLRSVGGSPTSRPSSSHLEIARARAFQAGVLSVRQFIEFSCPRPLLPTSKAYPINAPLSKLPPVFFERLYAAAGKPVPEHVRERLRREEEEEEKDQFDDNTRKIQSRKESKADDTVLIQGSKYSSNPGEKAGKAEWGQHERKRANKDDEEADDSGQPRRYPRSVLLSPPEVVHN